MARRLNKVGIAPPEPDFPVHEDEQKAIYGRGTRAEAELTLDDLAVDNDNKKFRVCLLGAPQTGKSAYLRQIIGKQLRNGHTYTPSTQEKRERVNKFRVTPERKVDIMIYDFGEQCADYGNLLTRNIERADGFFIFMYDGDQNAFETVETFLNRISDHKNMRDQTIAVMGKRAADWRDRQFTIIEGKDWCDTYSQRTGCFIHYFSYVADNLNLNVIQAMSYVVKGIMLKKNILKGEDPFDAEEKRPRMRRWSFFRR